MNIHGKKTLKITRCLIMTTKKITLIGPISPPGTGPGIKNKLLSNEFYGRLGKKKFSTINTLGFINKFKAIFKSLLVVFTKRSLIVSVSEKGRYFFVPIVWLKQQMNKGAAILLPAGGNLSNEIQDLPPLVDSVFVKMLQSFDKICPETYLLQKHLNEIGIDNTEVLPNPRKANSKQRKEFKKDKIEAYFISSIKKSKGILDCINAIEILNNNGIDACLNIYGRVKEDFEAEFRKAISNSKHSTYYGMLAHTKVTDTLATKADVLLLPTYYFGEGLPGILVESAMAGVPVIITKFKGIDYYFTHKQNALFVDKKNPEDIVNKIQALVEKDSLRKGISKNLKKTSSQFEVSTVTGRLIEMIRS